MQFVAADDAAGRVHQTLWQTAGSFGMEAGQHAQRAVVAEVEAGAARWRRRGGSRGSGGRARPSVEWSSRNRGYLTRSPPRMRRRRMTALRIRFTDLYPSTSALTTPGRIACGASYADAVAASSRATSLSRPARDRRMRSPRRPVTDPMTSFDSIGYAPSAQGVRPAASTSRNAHSSMTNPHLLLIDDDARLTRMVGDYLRTQGFDVDTAGTLADGRMRLAAGSLRRAGARPDAARWRRPRLPSSAAAAGSRADRAARA